ncbi:MAG TPA: CpsB/CapC family capsule biosynthesis tyrosine phosphatase [Clostridia bacterium]|nr:CpsB/CapC family capsule biosynthesis tyrosine phosphatase [Clostridia bacterium]
MIDIHCHVIPGVDDGAKTVEQTAEILEQAARAGIRTIIATPHYSGELHRNGTVDRNFELARKEALRYNITFLKGYEIKIRHYPAQMPEDYSDLTLGGSKHLLLELSRDRVPSYTLDLLYDLQLKGFIPIIAHPERCSRLEGNKQLFNDLIDMGCLMQVDAASIIGVNGRGAKRFVKRIITSGNATYVASDAHDPSGYSKWYVKAYKKVQKWIGKQKSDELFMNNAAELVGQNIEAFTH